MSDTRRVINNTLSTINLPPMTAKHHGADFLALAIEPGEQKIETARIVAIEALDVAHGLAKGWRKLTSPQSGKKPQLFVYPASKSEARDKAGKPLGPPPPDTIETYPDAVALKLVEVTDDKNALARWAKDARKPVADAASAKLASLAA